MSTQLAPLPKTVLLCVTLDGETCIVSPMPQGTPRIVRTLDELCSLVADSSTPATKGGTTTVDWGQTVRDVVGMLVQPVPTKDET
jgi:hypothetical protein